MGLENTLRSRASGTPSTAACAFAATNSDRPTRNPAIREWRMVMDMDHPTLGAPSGAHLLAKYHVGDRRLNTPVGKVCQSGYALVRRTGRWPPPIIVPANARRYNGMACVPPHPSTQRSAGSAALRTPCRLRSLSALNAVEKVLASDYLPNIEKQVVSPHREVARFRSRSPPISAL